MLHQTIETLADAVAVWNSGDVPSLLPWFTDDIAYCSPLIDDNGSRWVQGSQELSSHLLGLRSRFAKLELVDTLHGAGFANVILSHPGGRISMLIELSENRKARRIIVCHSDAPVFQAA